LRTSKKGKDFNCPWENTNLVGNNDSPSYPQIPLTSAVDGTPQGELMPFLN